VPNLFLIAGPNGAGKSTSAPEILSGPRRVAEFVNADVIAKEQGLSDVAAGRATLQRLTELTEARRDIAFETTLASQLLLPRIRAMQAAGYRFHLFFFWLREVGHSVRIGDNALWRQLTARYMKPRVEEQESVLGPEQAWTSQDIIDAIDRAVRAALKRHKERGESVVVWRDGKIIWLKPEEIDV